jgi:hypothetical protein
VENDMTRQFTEPPQIGVSESRHEKLRQLKDDGHFAEMADAYKFAVAFALLKGKSLEPQGKKITTFSTSTLDPTQALFSIVQETRESENEPVWRTIERLAEWGIEELTQIAESGEIVFSKLIEDANRVD